MDRAEGWIHTPEQLETYLALLAIRIHECRYPSGELMDRMERVMAALPRSA